jgi:PAS domain S-box-containing protein
LRQSEERFAKAFRLAPVPMMLTTLDGLKILDANDAFTAAFGVATADALDKTADALELWEDSKQRKIFEKSLRENAVMRNFEARLQGRDNIATDCLISAEVVAIQGQDCVLSVMLDISERKRSEADLVTAIEAVMKDTSWFSQTVMEKLANLRQPNRSSPRVELAALTHREREVLELICQGLTDGEISEKLGLSRNTIRNHVATLYGKIEVHRRSAAVVWARERGITGPKAKAAKRR